jgi:hypothetical protein
MKSIFESGKVTVEFDHGDYNRLQMIIGMALAVSRLPQHDGDHEISYFVLKFANDLNEGNPFWTPYKIPKEA